MKRIIGLVIALCSASLLFVFSSIHADETDRLFSDRESLETIREKIEQNGLEFSVEHNWVYDLSPEEKQRFFSRKKRLYIERDSGLKPTHRLRSLKMLPSSFDWRDRNGQAYIGPVRDQADCGSCYAFGAVAAAEGTYNVANGLTGNHVVDFSESFIMWCLGAYGPYGEHFFGCDGADYEYAELAALTKEGVGWESDFPYMPYDPFSCAHEDDPTVVFDEWGRIPCNDIDAMKTAIMTYGVIDVAVWVTDAFMAYSIGIFEDNNTQCEDCEYTDTNHAVALVGWDDNGDADRNGYWILRNSWGQGWGENGYMRIKYRSAAVACAGAYLVYNSGQIEPTLTHIAISGASSVNEGAETSLICNAYYSDDSFEDISADVAWQVDNGDDASINGAGLFTAFEVDENTDVSVTATYQNEFSATHTITILDGDDLVEPDLNSPDAYLTLMKNQVMFIIPAQSAMVIYGNNGVNRVGISSRSQGKMVNFPGANIIYVEDPSSLFTIRKNGSMALFHSDENSTRIELPSTQTGQKIVFADGAISLETSENGTIMLGQQEVTTVETPIGPLDDFTETSTGYWH